MLILCIILFFQNIIFTQDSWIQRANFPELRYRASSFSIENKGYVGTGLTPTKRTNDLWEYDPINNTWHQKADLPASGREGAFGFSINGKGYVGGGLTNTSGLFNDFWEYDPQTDQWTQKADIPINWASRGTLVSFTIGEKGYIRATFNDNDFWEYDAKKDSWTKKANFPGDGRLYQVGFSIGDKGYIGTGFAKYHPTSEFWEYNSATNLWSQKSNFPGSPRNGAVGFVIKDKGYIGLGNASGKFPRDFWSYDPVNDLWTQVDSCGYGADGAFCFTIGSKGYVGCGLFTSIGVFWEYDPSLDSFMLNSNIIEYFSLHQNYPNPFNLSTTIKYDLPEPSEITLIIYNILGDEIRVIFNSKLFESGSHSIVWNGLDNSCNMVSTGVYLYKIQAGNFIKIKKMLFLK